MTRMEALQLIKNNISQLEIKTNEANIQNIGQAMDLLNALIDLEHKEENAKAKPTTEEPTE